MSKVAVDLLVDALTDIIRDILNKTDFDVSVDMNVNVFTGVLTTFEFGMPRPLEDFRCRAAFDCRPMDCASVLQAWMPSYHV